MTKKPFIGKRYGTGILDKHGKEMERPTPPPTKLKHRSLKITEHHEPISTFWGLVLFAAIIIMLIAACWEGCPK